MKKKLVALLMVSAMAIGTLAGCGDDSKKGGDEKKPATEGEVKDVTLKVWAPENRVQSGTIDSMTKSFQKLIRNGTSTL